MTNPTPTPEPFRATPKQWDNLAVPLGYGPFARCVRELRDRVQALEAAQHAHTSAMSELLKAPNDNDAPQTLHTIALQHVGVLRSMGVLSEICSDLERAILQPMEAPPAEPTPPAGPDFSDGLLAAVKNAILCAPIGPGWEPEARAALRTIATWLRQRHGGSSTTADFLDAEADRP